MLLSIGNPTPSAQDQRAEAPVSCAGSTPDRQRTLVSPALRGILLSASMKDFFLRNGTIIDADGERDADLHWNDGVVRFSGETSRNSV